MNENSFFQKPVCNVCNACLTLLVRLDNSLDAGWTQRGTDTDGSSQDKQTMAILPTLKYTFILLVSHILAIKK